METSTPSTPVSSGTPRKLDTMSQEDLLKNCKKQMILLQKLKAKCDDQQNKLKAQDDYQTVKEENGSLKVQLNGKSEENQNLITEKNGLLKDKNSTAEELECVRLKQETLLSSLQCLQEDYNKALQENKQQAQDAEKTRKNVAVFKQKYKEMQTERQDLSNQLQDNIQQFAALKDHIKTHTASEQALKDKNQILEQENKAIKSELSALKISMEFFEQKKDDTNNCFEELEAKITELNGKVSALMKEKSEFLITCQNLEKEKLAAIENVEELKQVADSCAGKYENEVKELQENNTNLSQQVRNLDSKLKSETKAWEECNETLKSRLDESNKQNINSSSSILELKEENKAVHINNEQIKEELALSQKIYEDLKESLDLKVDELTGKLDLSIKAYEEKKSFVDDLEKRLQISESAFADLKTVVDQLNDQTNEQQSIIAQLSDDKKQTEMLQSSVEHNVAYAQEENLKLKKQITELQALLEIKVKEFNELQALQDTLLKENETTKLESSQEKLDMQKQIDVANSAVSQLQFEKASFETTNLNLAKQSASVTHDTEHLKIEIESFKTEVIDLEKQLASKKSEIEQFYSEMESSQAAKLDLVSQLDSANLSIQQLNTDNETLKNDIEKLRAEHLENMELLQSDKNDLFIKCEESEKQILSLKDSIGLLEATEKQLKSEILEMQTSATTDSELSAKLSVQAEENSKSLTRISELEVTVNSLTNSNGQMQEKLSDDALKISDLLKQNDSVNLELNNSKAKSVELLKEIATLKDQFNSSKETYLEQLNTATEENEAILAKYKELEEHEKNLEQQKIEVESKFSSEIENVKSKLLLEEENSCHLEKQIQDIQASECHRGIEYSEKCSTVEKLTNDVELLQEDCKTAKQNVLELENTLTGIRNEKESALRVASDLEATKDALQIKLESADSEITKLSAELQHIRGEVETLNIQQSTLLQSGDENNQTLDNLQNELRKENVLNEELKATVIEQNAQLASTASECKQLKSQLEELHTVKVEATEALNQDILKLNSQLQQVVCDHECDVNNWKQKYSELQAKILSTSEEHITLLTSEQQEKERLEASCDKLTKNLSKLEGDYSKLEAEFNKKSENEKDVLSTLSSSQEKQQTEAAENEKLVAEVESLTKEIGSLQEKIRSLVTTEQESLVKSNAESQLEFDTLKKTLKDKEIYNTKLKTLAVKARKELDVVKQQLHAAQEENNKLQTKLSAADSQLQGSHAHANNVQMMQIECDKLQDQVDLIKEEKQTLQKNIENLFNQLASEKQEKAEVQSKLDVSISELQQQKKEKGDVESLLASSKASITSLQKEKDNISKERTSTKQELDAVRIQLASLSKSVEDKEKKLTDAEQALKDAKMNMKQQSLISLEMEECEKTINDLQTEVADLESTLESHLEEISSLEERINDLQEENRAIEKLRLDAEDRVTKSKEVLDECREEIAHLSQTEAEIKAQLETTTSQLEQLLQQNEQQKLELSSRSSETRELQEQVENIRSSSARSVDILERKVNSMTRELNSQRAEYDSLSGDYESYKVRVHSVLKQQKTKEQKQAPSPDKTEILQLRHKASQLQTKLGETQSILTSREAELDLLQGDYDRLLRQQQQSSESAVEREGRWKNRVKSLQQELLSLRKQHAELTQKLSQQNDSVAEQIEREVGALRERHSVDTDLLTREVAGKDNELCALRNEIRSLKEEKSGGKWTNTSTPRKSSSSASAHHRHPSFDHHVHHLMTSPGLDYRSVAREDGEGEENPDTGSMVSFEQVLQTPAIKSVTEVSETNSMTSEMQVKHLETKLEANARQLEHLSEVAHESEAMSARLTDQNRVLKDEIRRLEKNQERDQSVNNLEYLKNVVYKFVTLPPSDERRHLLPVIDTMLKLSPEERATLQAIATDDDLPAEGQRSGGWGSYLQRWSGMQ